MYFLQHAYNKYKKPREKRGKSFFKTKAYSAAASSESLTSTGSAGRT